MAAVTWTDTPQQKAALRSNSVARKCRAMFPAGQRVAVTPGCGAEPRPGAMQGTVVRHVPAMNSQGGYLTVRWDNGVTGRVSCGSATPVSS